MPYEQAPQLCSLAENPPDGSAWLSEIKLDGYRFLAAVEDGRVRLLTRNGHDWANRMPSIAAAFKSLPVKSAMLDGELVSLRADGVSTFHGLQAALKDGRDDTLTFYAFDLLHLDGWDLRGCSLVERKRILAGLADWTGMLRYSDHHVGDTHAMLKGACQMKLEGIICKKSDGLYRPGRGADWVKVKCSGREEFVVLGWTAPGGSRLGIGALQVGYRDPEGNLQYAGAVGTGFNDKELKALHERFRSMTLAEPPSNLRVSGDPIDPTTVWIRQELVAEVQYASWSGAGRVRHAVYLGLREDKEAGEVVRDSGRPRGAADTIPADPNFAKRVRHARGGTAPSRPCGRRPRSQCRSVDR